MKKTNLCKFCKKRGHTDKTDICGTCLHIFGVRKTRHKWLTKDIYFQFKQSGLNRLNSFNPNHETP